MPTKTVALVALINETRRAFQDLGAYANALHGVNSSMRAVMEFIDQRGPATAPAMARAKNVSRQHIQTIVDQLIEAGLAEQRDNPAHRRSHLIALTRAGRSLFADMKKREVPAYAGVAKALSIAEMRAATKTLAALRAAISDQQRKGDVHEPSTTHA